MDVTRQGEQKEKELEGFAPASECKCNEDDEPPNKSP